MPSKQKSGLYRTKVKIGVDANGKNVYKWISGKTKRELEQRRQDVIATYIEGKQPARDVLFQAITPPPTTLHKPPKTGHIQCRYSPSERNKSCKKVVQ